MEAKAYIEGIVRKWWLLVAVSLLSYLFGGLIASWQTPAYATSTSILLNDKLLANSAFSTHVVQLSIPQYLEAAVFSPAVSHTIMQSYPRLSAGQLQKNVSISTDQTQQILLINVTDVSPAGAADIANYLAQNFVQTQTLSLRLQLRYYQQWLQSNATRLNEHINTLNTLITAATPPRPLRGPVPSLTPQQAQIIRQYETQANEERRTLSTYQQTLQEIQQALPLIPSAYTILKPADVPQYPITSPFSATTIQLISLAVGLFLTICLCIGIDFFTPAIRHQGELHRFLGITTLIALPQLYRFEQRRLLKARGIPFVMQRIRRLQMLCAIVGTFMLKDKGQTILLTGLQKKHNISALLATFQAYKGYKTLVVDADFEQPCLHKHIQATVPHELPTIVGQLVKKTSLPNLYFLPATATLLGGQPLTEELLIKLLPALRREFELIIVNAPPIDRHTTHMLAPKAGQVLLFIKQRCDTMKQVQVARSICETMKVHPHYVLLT